MFVVSVRVHVLAEHVPAFIEVILTNARASRQEHGNVRFDVLQSAEDPCRFTLYEVYKHEADFHAHQKTPHYLAFREAAAPMMASPRIGEKHHSLFPEPWQ